METDALYRHFRRVVEARVGRENAGSRFVAVTDPGSPLEKLARRDAFREAFFDPPGVVGRYSALSFFGLVPAALSGLDVRRLLERGAQMRRRCGAEAPMEENPGALLGAAMGHAALEGRRQADAGNLAVHSGLRPLGGAASRREHREGWQGHRAGGRRAPRGDLLLRQRQALRLPAPERRRQRRRRPVGERAGS